MHRNEYVKALGTVAALGVARIEDVASICPHINKADIVRHFSQMPTTPLALPATTIGGGIWEMSWMNRMRVNLRFVPAFDPHGYENRGEGETWSHAVGVEDAIRFAYKHWSDKLIDYRSIQSRVCFCILLPGQNRGWNRELMNGPDCVSGVGMALSQRLPNIADRRAPIDVAPYAVYASANPVVIAELLRPNYEPVMICGLCAGMVDPQNDGTCMQCKRKLTSTGMTAPAAMIPLPEVAKQLITAQLGINFEQV